MKDIAYALSLGISIVISFIFGIGIGFFIDNKFNLNGLGMVVGILIGVLMAFGYLFKMMRNSNDG